MARVVKQQHLGKTEYDIQAVMKFQSWILLLNYMQLLPQGTSRCSSRLSIAMSNAVFSDLSMSPFDIINNISVFHMH
ncbi:hypothetical protein SUGI_1082650 [Cryptomeria japonica]|nr:hypothetical protein SUGI_1082650 [Cryptomeria japonica]